MRPYPLDLHKRIESACARVETLRRRIRDRDRIDHPADERARNRRILEDLSGAKNRLIDTLREAEA